MIGLTRRSAVAFLLATPLASCGPSKDRAATVAEIAVQVPMAMLYVARLNGYWKTAGIEVKTSSFSSGRLALDALLGRAANFSGGAVTPLALAGLRRNNFRIISQLSVSPNELSIVTRRTSKIASPTDLLGKKVAYPIGTQAEFFFDKYMRTHGIEADRITIVSAAPPDCVSAISKGEVDAIVTFRPHSLNALGLLGTNGAMLDTRSLYTSVASLICETRMSEEEPELVRAILEGLIEAETFIAREQKQAIELVSKEVGLEASRLAQYFGDYSFKAVLTPDLLTALVAEGSWGARSAKDLVAPDYRALIADQHLRSIDAKRVTL